MENPSPFSACETPTPHHACVCFRSGVMARTRDGGNPMGVVWGALDEDGFFWEVWSGLV